MKRDPILYIVIPCYNEEEVLLITSTLFLHKLESFLQKGLVHPNSRILFVDDGSKDHTWEIICGLHQKNALFQGISLSRNRGHQNALLAGLMEAVELCDITISIDCDGQDDINAMDKMLEAYQKGSEIVYGVRDNRESDSFFKRNTAQGFYRFLNRMGAEVVYNHADYRLVSSRVLKEFKSFEEVNLYLRGMFPLIGFPSSAVTYTREERLAGESHYPLSKMLALAMNGITSLSIKPLRLITSLGFVISVLSFIAIIWSIVVRLFGNATQGWASMVSIICFLGGIQLLSIGVLGEYIGKIYMETKHRPRFIIAERTQKKQENPHQKPQE